MRDWLGSPLRAEIAAATRVRAEVPILLSAGSTVLRGSIDLLVERDGLPPLVVDYKTDRLRGDDPATRAAHYEVQRSIYALAAKESLGATEVEVAYVFLERADSPVRTVLTEADMAAGRTRIEAAVASISAGNFEPAPEPERTWDLCRGCPALGPLVLRSAAADHLCDTTQLMGRKPAMSCGFRPINRAGVTASGTGEAALESRRAARSSRLSSLRPSPTASSSPAQ